eukprot:gene25189-16882_t
MVYYGSFYEPLNVRVTLQRVNDVIDDATIYAVYNGVVNDHEFGLEEAPENRGYTDNEEAAMRVANFYSERAEVTLPVTKELELASDYQCTTLSSTTSSITTTTISSTTSSETSTSASSTTITATSTTSVTSSTTSKTSTSLTVTSTTKTSTSATSTTSITSTTYTDTTTTATSTTVTSATTTSSKT